MRFLTIALLLGVFGVAGCGPSSNVCEPTGNADVPDPAFVDDDCDGVDGDPTQAIYVSLLGNDGSIGTRTAPVRTINRGIAVAVENGLSWVFVDEGEYGEQVELVSGVSVFGGYSAANGWSRSADTKTTVRAPSPAVRALDVNDVRVEWVFIEAENAEQNESSYAVWIENSTAVTFAYGSAVGGTGGLGSSGSQVGAQAPSGNMGVSSTGAVEVPTGTFVNELNAGGAAPCSCGAGGAGGQATVLGAGVFTHGEGYVGAGGTCAVRSGEASMGSGDNGASGGDALQGSSGLWTVAGYVPGDGLVGESGEDGQGGNGGAASAQVGAGCDGGDPDSVLVPPSGGGGGSGGCGGVGGGGGQGGGASVGVFATASDFALDHMVIESNSGGDGGPGGTGQQGGDGALGGVGHGGGNIGCGLYGGTGGMNYTGSEDGGPGGDGGKGGDGSGGSGGWSVGVVVQGGSYNMTAVDYQIGAAGSPGSGSGAAPAGLAGETAELLVL